MAIPSYTIFVVGDVEFMKHVLNGVAMLNGTSMERVAAIGALIGILLSFFQSLANGAQKIEVTHILIGMIVYSLAYGNTTKVTVEDVYTGTTRVVDNVPYGIAAVGSMVSQLGVGISKKMSTAYTSVTATTSDAADTLQLMAKLQKVMGDASLTARFDAREGGATNIESSIKNYVKDCLDVRYTLRPWELSRFHKDNVWDALQFASTTYTTFIYQSSGETQVTCTDAYKFIKRVVATPYSDSMIEDYLNARLGRPNEPVNSQAAISNQLIAIGGTATDVSEFIQTVYLLPIIEDSLANAQVSKHDVAASIMMAEAINSRNAQWAAEGSLFIRSMRPMMAFFEGFIYAVSPLMMFVIMLGSKGFSLAGKYLLTMIWIQLWKPVIAIISLYANLSATGQMEAIKDSVGTSTTYAPPYLTFDGVPRMIQISMDWIGIAGMLTAATPALTLMLIYGSAVTATSLASRMVGGDHIDEKKMTPDIYKQDAALKVAASQTYDQGGSFNSVQGNLTNGADVPQFSLGSALSNTAQSAQMVSSTSGTSFNRAIESGFRNARSVQEQTAMAAAVGAEVSAGHSSVAGTTSNLASQSGYDGVLSAQQNNALTGVTSLVANGNIEGSLGADIINSVVGMAQGSSFGSDFLQNAMSLGEVKDANGNVIGGGSEVGMPNKDVAPHTGGVPQTGGSGGSTQADKPKLNSPNLGLSGRAGAEAKTGAQTQDQQGQQSSYKSSKTSGTQISDTDQSEYRDALKATSSVTSGVTDSNVWEGSQAEKIGEQIQAARAQSQSVQALQANMDSQTLSASTDLAKIGFSLANGKIMPDFNERFQALALGNPELNQRAKELETNYSSDRFGMLPQQAKYAGMFMALNEPGAFSNDPTKGLAAQELSLETIGAQVGANFDLPNVPVSASGELPSRGLDDTGMPDRAFTSEDKINSEYAAFSNEAESHVAKPDTPPTAAMPSLDPTAVQNANDENNVSQAHSRELAFIAQNKEDGQLIMDELGKRDSLDTPVMSYIDGLFNTGASDAYTMASAGAHQLASSVGLTKLLGMDGEVQSPSQAVYDQRVDRMLGLEANQRQAEYAASHPYIADGIDMFSSKDQDQAYNMLALWYRDGETEGNGYTVEGGRIKYDDPAKEQMMENITDTLRAAVALDSGAIPEMSAIATLNDKYDAAHLNIGEDAYSDNPNVVRLGTNQDAVDRYNSEYVQQTLDDYAIASEIRNRGGIGSSLDSLQPAQSQRESQINYDQDLSTPTNSKKEQIAKNQ